MSNNDIIRSTDIAESGAVKPITDEFVALLKVLNDVDGQIKVIAKDLKVTLSSTNSDSLGGMKKLNDTIKNTNDLYVEANNIKKQRLIYEEKLRASMTEEARALADLRNQLQDQNKLNRDSARLNNENTSAYKKAVIELNRMAKTLKDLAILGKGNEKTTKDLKKAYDELFVSVSNAERSVGQHQRNVGNYASGFSRLKDSINQVTRELPAFTNSVQTGFMAISNNIPMLVDQMRNLNAENARLKANGEATVPVWKQMVQGIFSWQSALSVGITLLTVFSKEIWAGVQSLFGYEDAAKAAEQAQKDFNDAIEEGRERSTDFRNSWLKQIEFETKAQVAAAKSRGATEKEIRDIEDRGRQNALDKLLKFQHDQMYLEYQLRDEYFKLNEELKDSNDEKDKQRVSSAKAAFEAQKDIVKQAGIDIETYLAESTMRMREREADDAEKARKAREKAAEDARKEEERRLKEWEKSQEDIRKFNLKKMKEGIVTFLDETHKVLVQSIRKDTDAAVRMANEAKTEMQSTQRVSYEEYRKAADKGYKETRDKDEKEQQKMAQEREKALQQSISTLEKYTQKEADIKNQQITEEINASEKRQEYLKELAVKGSLDAQNSLAQEQRKQAELEQERLRALKNQKRQEIIFAGLRAYSSNLDKNPTGALGNTIKDLTILTSFLGALPAFLEGTENTGKNGEGIDGKGGFLSVLHPEERVLNKEQNKKIGSYTNDELANLAYMANLGVLTTDNSLLQETKVVGHKIDKLASIIEQKPTHKLEVDELQKLIHITTENKYSRKITTRRIGGYGR